MPRASRLLCLLFCLLLPPRTMAESPQEPFLRSALQAAATVGLDPADYSGPDFTANVRRYVADLNYGRIDPAAAGHGLRTDRSRLDVDATVAQMLTSDDVARDLAAVEPRSFTTIC